MTLTTTITTPGRPQSGAHLTAAQLDELAREVDAIRAEVAGSLGASDARYIRDVIALQRGLEATGRALLLAGRVPAAWIAGVGMLSVAKILENMEIGHNVIHGQWDWLRDPDIHSTTWEWDNVAPARAWKHTHNDLHHTWTNVVGRDDDVGYNLLRVTDQQPWTPRALANVPLNMLLAPFFEWGIAIYGLEIVDYREGRKSKAALRRDLAEFATKAARQGAKDYAATPLLAQLLTRSGLAALTGTLAANVVRNLWTHAVIFCGHFPDGIETFPEASVEGESRGQWCVRQLTGSGNIDGGRLLHVLTGHLSFQIEHHLFPDLPSNHYPAIAPRVRALCAKYGLPYTSGPLARQVWQTWRSIGRLSLPDAARRLLPGSGRRRAARARRASVAGRQSGS
jgi:linoleoyl-CoA desaturase